MTTTPVPSTPPTPPAPQVLLQMASGAWVAQALYAAARYGIADRLAQGPRTTSELALATETIPERLERLLRALAGEGVFKLRDDGRYENTPLSEPLRADVPGSIRPIVLMMNEEHYTAWTRFHECLRVENTAFELQYGEPIFAWYARHPQQARTFNEAMQAYSAAHIPAILAVYDPSAARTIVDIGGGHGQLMHALLARAPQARGIVFDLEQGLAGARAIGLDRDPRVELVAGNFFETAPQGDLYVLKHILHDWTDEQCALILKHVRAGLAPGGKVLVVELLIGAPNESSPAN